MAPEIQSRNVFDRFSAWAAAVVSRAPFFAFCVLLIFVWAPTIVWFSIDTWQLIINTITTIITFLLVALLQNTADRSQQAVTHKLDAALRALAFLLEHDDRAETDDLERELRTMTGVEMEPSKTADDGD